MPPANTDPTNRPASPAKRSAAIMEGAEPPQDKAEPPPYQVHQESAVPLGIDDQIQHIQSLMATEVQQGSRGFVVAAQWLRRVLARASDANQKDFEPHSIEGEIGKIDNSSVVVPGAFDNAIRFPDKTDLPFVPLRLGVERPVDFDILPEEAWDQVVAWYGLAEGQLPIVRFAHDTSPAGSTVKNVMYELNPPVFTIRKVLSAATSSQSAASDAAVKLVASRTERFQTFLARAKQAAGIPLAHKVRIWRQLVPSEVSGPKADATTQGILSPPMSRAPSPSPTSSQPLVVDAPTFTKWAEGVDHESVDAKDHTSDEKYNGTSTLDILGLIADQTLVLEEQIRGPAGGEFASDSRRKPLQNASQATQSGASSRRTSPAPPSGPVTRGRTRKDGKPRGAVGLTNLGNTCYMNSALQCISRVEELAVYFLSQKHKTEINSDNPLGYNGKIANSYASLLGGLYGDNSASAYRPSAFKGALSMAQPMFSGYGQQDSQEFLSFLVDALHEDLNRIHKKPYIENPDSDDATVHDPEAIRQLGEKYREIHTARNDSIAMDLFNGFYKNTMVCPTCEKVSVTFDPYSLLTLQLPIENTWQAKVMFMPLTGRPSTFEIDIDKNAPVRSLKDFFVNKIGNGLTRDRLLFAEMFSRRFYKVMPDPLSISEAGIEARDILCMYELPAVPTNTAFVPKKQQGYRSVYDNSSVDMPDMDSPLAETMAIPVLHAKGETRPGSPNLVLNPTFITVTREEAKDYDAIMRRVLAAIAPMTTKNFLEEFDESHTEQSAVAISEAENEPVDVPMQDTNMVPAGQLAFMQPGAHIPPGLRSAFELKYIPPSSDMFATGTSNPGNVRPMQERVHIPGERRGSTTSSTSDASRKSEDSGFSRQGRSSSESDEDADTAVDSFKATEPAAFSGDVESEDELGAPSALEGLSAKASRRDKFLRKNANKSKAQRGRNGRQQNRSNVVRSPTVETTDSNSDDGYYIKLGECIVVDWHKDAFDALFGGADDQGQFTFDEKNVPLVEDQDLQAKRNKRLQRKKNGITLDDCFTETGKTEVLSEDNAWFCGRCKELRRASKTLEMWTTPDILVVHLKRFSGERYRRDKIDILVDFPVEGLDLTEKVGCKEDGKEYIYDLFAVDNHYGGLGGGHYTAYAKNFYDGQWYDYNDSSVSRHNPGGVVSTAAYLLFYRRRSSTPLGPPYLQELVHKARNPSDGSDIGDESGEGTRLGDNSSASSRLLGSSIAGAAGAEAAISGTLQQGVNDDGPGRGANQGVRLMNDDYNDDEGVSLDDSLYNDNSTRAVTLAQGEASWGWDTLDDDTMAVNTPAESDQPEAGSDAEDRFLDFQDDDQAMQNGDTYDTSHSLVEIVEDDQQDVDAGSNK